MRRGDGYIYIYIRERERGREREKGWVHNFLGRREETKVVACFSTAFLNLALKRHESKGLGFLFYSFRSSKFSCSKNPYISVSLVQSSRKPWENMKGFCGVILSLSAKTLASFTR